MEIYTFSKTFQERLNDYMQIFSIHKIQETVPASQIQSLWSCYLEYCIEPSGWEALWKIPHYIHKELRIAPMMTVLVSVETINFPELTVHGKIQAVDDNVSMMSCINHKIPLIELFPTVNQKSTALDAKGTAVCIDQLRFFYEYIWWPSDINEGSYDKDWMNCHLESRMRMLFYMNQKIVNREPYDVIGASLNEANQIIRIIAKEETSINAGKEVLEEEKLTLSRYRHRLKQITMQLEILESLSWKTVFVRHNESSSNVQRKNVKKKKMCYLIVKHSNTIQELQKLPYKIQELLSKDTLVRMCGSLEGALNNCNEHDTILLVPEIHATHSSSCKVIKGGTIKGISDLDVPNSSNTYTIPIVECSATGAVFEYFGTEFHLENIRINVQNLQAGIVAKRGSMKIVNCNIHATNSEVTDSLGIVVLPDAKVTIENTSFHGFRIAVVLHQRGEVTMTKCKFETCYDAIHFTDNALLILSKCQFHNISNFAIRMETLRYLDELTAMYINETSLPNIAEISTSGCEFHNIIQAVVALEPKGIASIPNTNTEVAEDRK